MIRAGRYLAIFTHHLSRRMDGSTTRNPEDPQDQMGTRFNKRWLGRRIKHQMGSVSIKMYDKFNQVLPIETTVNDVSFFQQYRRVYHRDGSSSKKFAKLKKTIYSLWSITSWITISSLLIG